MGESDQHLGYDPFLIHAAARGTDPRTLADRDAEIDRLRAALAESERKRVEILAVLRPTKPRPCDCTRCDCGNPGDAQSVAAWDAEHVAYEAALRLATPTQQTGEGKR